MPRGPTTLALPLAALFLACGPAEPTSDPDAPLSDGGDPELDAGGMAAGEPASLSGITALHNSARAEVGAPALLWDPALAVVAQSWAEACVDNAPPAGLIDHNDGRSENYPGYVGENIYGAGGTATAQDAVAAWMSEESDYDIASNSCSGPACGHYTQVIWTDSNRLGCGVHTCPGLQYGGSIVCNYAPGGNVGGERPYPYP